MTIQYYIDALKYKIGDPTETSANVIFSPELKADYVIRAYYKLIRTLTLVMRGKRPFFSKLYKEMELGTIVNNRISLTRDQDFIIVEIFELLIDKVKATYVEADLFYNHKDKKIVGSPTKESPYYTIIGNEIKILPEDQLNNKGVKAIVSYNVKADGLDNNSNLDVPTEYEDLLLTFAAMEAMEDIGLTNKVQLYQSELNFHLQLIAGYTNLKEQKEGTDINGK